MDVKEKRKFIFDRLADFFKQNDFKKRNNNFFKNNEDIGYCINIQNDRWNNDEQIRFTLNLGVFTDRFWLEHYDFKKTGIVPKFPREVECAIRERIGKLVTKKEDKWYCITSDTNIFELWSKIKCDLTECAMPFFNRYSSESDVVPNQCIYK